LITARPTFFATPQRFRAWLERHAARETELLVGFHKRGSGRPSITWPEAVDEALCFGWIDAVRKRIDEESYQIRFTRRKPGSTWSAVNIGRVNELTAKARMTAEGLAAFARRSEAKSRIYAYEQATGAVLDPAALARFRKDKAAWVFFEKQAPSYRQRVIWGIVNAKREETREKRLVQLMQASRKGERL
jgi:uncharacterized protein YdeI (YjbR/CyaY-like superfamily)